LSTTSLDTRNPLLPTADRQMQLVGGTPLVRLQRLPGESSAEVWVKCEHLNPGGSVKDRVALAMIETAEREGRIRPGESIIVEPTSGNTGIALAFVCAAKGYRLLLTVPESLSPERQSLLRSYGAELLLTPPERSTSGAVEVAKALCATHAHYFMPDQFRNRANPEVHRRTTAPELLAQLEGRGCDAFVVGVGTGGTLTGVGEVLKAELEDCQVIAVEPAASAVLSGGATGSHQIEGIGIGHVPELLNRKVIDRVFSVTDRQAFNTMRALANQEGLLVGISSGANAFAACQVARALGPGRTVATVMVDTGERYFSLDKHFEKFT
jgi:cysteine synthase A